jgi:hypothetical protein
MFKKALPLSLSESVDMINGIFASRKTAKFLQKSPKYGAKIRLFFSINHVRINFVINTRIISDWEVSPSASLAGAETGGCRPGWRLSGA